MFEKTRQTAIALGSDADSALLIAYFLGAASTKQALKVEGVRKARERDLPPPTHSGGEWDEHAYARTSAQALNEDRLELRLERLLAFVRARPGLTRSQMRTGSSRLTINNNWAPKVFSAALGDRRFLRDATGRWFVR